MRTISEEEKDYRDYNDAFLKYSDLLEDKIDDHIRNSHNRLKVSKLMEEYILESGDKKQETYINYLRLVDSWFSYEVYIKTIEKIGFANVTKLKTERLKKDILALSGCNQILDSAVIGIWDLPDSEELNKKLSYYKYLIDDESVSKYQVKNINNIINKVQNHKLKEITHFEFLSLCYAIRNSYAHNGETARSGTSSYIIKIELLNLCYHYILRIMYRYCRYMLIELIKDID